MEEKPEKFGAFQDGDGNVSSKRISSFVCIVTAVAIGLGGWISKAENTAMIVGLVASFLSSGLALQGIAWGSELSMFKKKTDDQNDQSQGGTQ